jgi:Fe-S cluster assembly iron-binding protein IscA
MLNVSADAAGLIKATIGSDSGLRIEPAAVDGNEVALKVAVATAPAETDEVVSAHGSLVFIDERVADLLDGKTLDTSVGDDGDLHLAVVG